MVNLKPTFRFVFVFFYLLEKPKISFYFIQKVMNESWHENGASGKRARTKDDGNTSAC